MLAVPTALDFYLDHQALAKLAAGDTVPMVDTGGSVEALLNGALHVLVDDGLSSPPPLAG